MADEREDVYCTLLMNDGYLPGALVLGRSLRDGKTKKKLAVMVTLDTVGADAVTELQATYDYIIPVERFNNINPANLHLMGRPDLIGTFTKINLWRLIQFRTVVYVDADIVALRPPDELFELDTNFAAAPDIGWPDCFNSGVMVIKPNMEDYYSLLALSARGISFDGADQGLFNMHFKNYHRISFRYNVTPSGNYQYLPAFRHYRSTISMVHFIGTDKPWRLGRHSSNQSGSYGELLAEWWAVYDRHYRVPDNPLGHSYSKSVEDRSKQARTVRQYVAGEEPPALFVPPPPHIVFSAPEDYRAGGQKSEDTGLEPAGPAESHSIPPTSHIQPGLPAPEPEPEPEPEPFSAPMADWDAAHFPPPADSKPEAENFPQQLYSNTWDQDTPDPGFFVAPPTPEPPKNMWYEVPPKPVEPPKPKMIFPWEAKQEKPTRVFPPTKPPSPVPEPEPEQVEEISAPETPVSPADGAFSPDPWDKYTRTNAWDELPGIGRYVQAYEEARLARRSKPESLLERRQAESGRKDSLILTDFPSAVERPSLPVTPAPRRRNMWGSDDAEEELPEADGVTDPASWDPAAKLDELTKHQAEIIPKVLQDPTPANPLSPSLDRDGKKIPERVLVESFSPQGTDEAENPFSNEEDEFSFVQSPKPRRLTGLPPKLANHGVDAEGDDGTTSEDSSRGTVATGSSALGDDRDDSVPPEVKPSSIKTQ